MKPPIAHYDLDLYHFWWETEGIDITLDRMQEAKGGELVAQIEVRRGDESVKNLVHQAKFNLSTTRTRAELVRALSLRIADLDWGACIEQVCFKALEHWRTGDPLIDLNQVAPREGSRYLLTPYVEYGGPTVLFAKGGTGKSLFGLTIACSIAYGVNILGTDPTERMPTLYLDWESDEQTHAERLRAVLSGAGITPRNGTVFYRRCGASLVESAPTIRRMITERGIGFVVVDSLGAARNGEPESAETTIRLFNAARTLGVGQWIGIDHMTKNGGAGQSSPFGSVYTENAARLTWSMEQVEAHDNGDQVVALANHKSNNGQKLPRRGYDVAFRADTLRRLQSVTYRERDGRTMPDHLQRGTILTQLTEVLERGALSVSDIVRVLEAEGVTLGEQTARTTLNRHKDRFVPVYGDDGKQRWGLLSTP